MRKSKADKTLKGICIYYFVQYFEKHCLSLSGLLQILLTTFKY